VCKSKSDHGATGSGKTNSIINLRADLFNMSVLINFSSRAPLSQRTGINRLMFKGFWYPTVFDKTEDGCGGIWYFYDFHSGHAGGLHFPICVLWGIFSDFV